MGSDKKILLFAAIVAIALIVFGVLNFLSFGETFTGASSKKRELKTLDTASQLDAVIEGVENPIGKDGEEVHKGVPNSWWLKYGLDPSFKDSLKRDPDGDGFNNEEEYNANTSPIDLKSFPGLLDKVIVKDFSELKWKVYYTSDGGPNQYKLRYEDAKSRKARTGFIGAGDNFFSDDPVNLRFVLKAVEERDLEKNGITTKKKYALIEDTKKGADFEIIRGSRNDYLAIDYTVTFALNALGKSKDTVNLEENTRFDLPNFEIKEDGKYHFLKVENDKAIIIEYSEGKELDRKKLSL